jgi:hypothetical protein
MALGVKLNVRVAREGERTKFDAWAKLLENPPKPEDMRFIRIEGTSATGPCPQCAQFFFMEHDGSGRVVPLVPLHENCVCQDIPVQIASETVGGISEPLQRGEWLEKVATPEKKAQILGKGKAALVESKAVPIDKLFSRAASPLATVKNLDRIASAVEKGKTKKTLARLARAAGVAVSAKMTRADIVNAIIGRTVL